MIVMARARCFCTGSARQTASSFLPIHRSQARSAGLIVDGHATVSGQAEGFPTVEAIAEGLGQIALSGDAQEALLRTK